MDDESGGLLSISLSDSDSEQQDSTKPARRTDQTEDEFRAIKETYHAKVENGNTYKSVSLPLEQGARKPLIQEVIYAAEELYFFRKFDEGVEFLSKVLAEGEGESKAFDAETREMLAMYKRKCEQKLTR